MGCSRGAVGVGCPPVYVCDRLVAIAWCEERDADVVKNAPVIATRRYLDLSVIGESG